MYGAVVAAKWAQPHTWKGFGLITGLAPTMLRQINITTLSVPNALWTDSILLIKRTFQPSFLRWKRKHGYLKRLRTANGRKIIARRRAKGRWRI